MKKLTENEHTERLTSAELARPLGKPLGLTHPSPVANRGETRQEQQHKARIKRLAEVMRSSGPVLTVASYTPDWRRKDRVTLGFSMADVGEAMQLLGTDVDEDALARLEAAETSDPVWKHPVADCYRSFLTVTRTGDQP